MVDTAVVKTVTSHLTRKKPFTRLDERLAAGYVGCSTDLVELGCSEIHEEPTPARKEQLRTFGRNNCCSGPKQTTPSVPRVEGVRSNCTWSEYKLSNVQERIVADKAKS